MAKQFRGVVHDFHETLDADHGRMGVRRVWCTPKVEWFKDRHKLKGLRSLALVEEERHLNDQISIERRYYLSSLPGDNAQLIGESVRSHWGIENSQHWVLDVALKMAAAFAKAMRPRTSPSCGASR